LGSIRVGGTMYWIITIPKTIKWEEYSKELKSVESRDSVLNYRVSQFPKKMAVGDLCYLLWDGKVRGWMEIVGLKSKKDPWKCTTTGKFWPPGKYLQRSGPFHKIDGPLMQGFQGVRSYPGKEKIV